MLIVDVVSPYAVRRLEVYGENKYLQWSGTPETLKEFDHEKRELIPVKLKEQTEHREGYSAFVVENAYKNEIREFFEVVNHGKASQYGFEQDFKVLKLIDSLEGNV
jgi:predicted dehydrogenase